MIVTVFTGPQRTTLIAGSARLAASVQRTTTLWLTVVCFSHHTWYHSMLPAEER